MKGLDIMLLTVDGICKRYDGFALEDVSFELSAGYIMGLVGRNGAGKTTVIKAAMGLLNPDSGRVLFDGKDISRHGEACRQEIGFVCGGADFYPNVRISKLVKSVKRFYKLWSDEDFEEYMRKFRIDSESKISELSEGAKIKFSLALALSHGARLLILDEPTGSLDPVSRDDLLGLMQELIETGERSVLFSTQIISDTEKCADYIAYLKDGRLLACTEKESFVDCYKIIRGSGDKAESAIKAGMLGCRRGAFGFTGLIRSEHADRFAGVDIQPAAMEDIMIYLERGID